MVEYYFDNLFLFHFLELLASLAGSYYLFKVDEINKVIRIFVYFLWVTFLIDFLGIYSVYAYFEDYNLFYFIKNTPIERNVWLFNSFKIISFSMYSFLFISRLRKPVVRKTFLGLLAFFIVSAIINLVFSGVFFETISSYTYILGTILILLSIISWYFQLLTSDAIVNFYRNIFFYLSVGALIWHLIVTPLFIFNNYFARANPAFLELHSIILKLANIFMYLTFSIGFLFCSNRNSKAKSLSAKINSIQK